jgi:hypothetical protein
LINIKFFVLRSIYISKLCESAKNFCFRAIYFICGADIFVIDVK